MSAMTRCSNAVRLPAWGLLVLVVAALGFWQDVRAGESASFAAASGSGDLKIRLRDGKKLTLHDWILESDTLRGTRDAWVDYERVRKPEAFALSEVTLQDGNLSGEGLRAVLEARQAGAAAGRQSVPGVAPTESVAPSSPSAQPSAPRVRMRVCLNDSPETWRTGTLLKARPDSLWLLSSGAGDTLAFKRANLSRAQTFEGRSANSGKGALIGLGIGVASGLALGAASAPAEGHTKTGDTILAATVLGAGGALIGALVGALIEKDEWVDVPHAGVSIQGSTDSIRMSVGFGPPPSGRLAVGDRH